MGVDERSSRLDNLDHPAIERPPRRTIHHSRSLTDFDLRSEVRLARLTPDQIIEVARRFRSAYWNFSPSVRDIHLGQLAIDIAAFLPWSYELGNLEGLVTFQPDVTKRVAELHILVWSPRFYRRPDLGRAVIGHAFQTFGFSRLTAIIPSKGSFANKLVQQLGFQREGVLRHFFCYPSGEPLDANLWGLLREDF